MNVFLDIETIPDQAEGAIGEIASTLTVKCPFKTKGETGKDLGLTEAEYKFISAGDLQSLWVEKKGKEQAAIQAESQWRKTSFDGGKGQACSIAWANGESEIESLSRDDFSEREIIYHFFKNFNSGGTSRPPFFIGHNIRFDLKFLYRRCVVLGINPGIKIPFYGRHGSDFYCTSEAWAGYNEKISQDNLCKILGIEGKPDDIDGSKVWDTYKNGGIKRIEEYNRDDVKKVRMIFNRLTFNGELAS